MENLKHKALEWWRNLSRWEKFEQMPYDGNPTQAEIISAYKAWLAQHSTASESEVEKGCPFDEVAFNPDFQEIKVTNVKPSSLTDPMTFAFDSQPTPDNTKEVEEAAKRRCPLETYDQTVRRARQISKYILYSPVTNGKSESSLEDGTALILTFAANQSSQTNELLKEAAEALHELIQVKDWKDEYGKDEQYQKAMPMAWQNARSLLSKINTFNLHK